MSTATTEGPVAIPATPAASSPYRMSYGVYERIAELEVIPREDHVVLLDGFLVQAMTKGPPHFNSVDRGADVFRGAVPRGWSVRVEGPVVLRDGPGGDSAPEPDLAVVVGSRERYEDRHPEAAEVGLIVEVASSAAAFAEDKAGLRRYAHAGIARVWIVALHDRTIHVCTEPSGPTAVPNYGHVEVRRSGEMIEAMLPPQAPGEPPAVLGPIAVASFFPPAR